MVVRGTGPIYFRRNYINVKPAARPEELLDNLTSLRAILSLALNYVQEAQDEFVNANHEYFCRFDESFVQIVVVTQRLEKEFNRIEYLRAARDIGHEFRVK
jgi:hypothetical protein